MSQPDTQAFDLWRGTSALVLDSPHSGSHYPLDFRHACSRQALHVEEDTQIDHLWRPAIALGATLVAARFPRTYIDANRALEDLDPEMIDEHWPDPLVFGSKVRLGKGLVWRTLDSGAAVYDRLLSIDEVRHRIDNYWRPYHAVVAEAIDAAHSRHGRVLHLNCHSMPSVAGPFSTEFPYTKKSPSASHEFS
jgi:N-formylglutamate deformylase